jgi:hypothetical protein
VREYGYKMPDYELVHQALAKSGVTLLLPWFEYCDKCRNTSEIPYQLTWFKKYYPQLAIACCDSFLLTIRAKKTAARPL